MIAIFTALISPAAITLLIIATIISTSVGLDLPPKLCVTSLSFPVSRKHNGSVLGHGNPKGGSKPLYLMLRHILPHLCRNRNLGGGVMTVAFDIAL